MSTAQELDSTTYFHGTSPALVDKIKREGLRTSTFVTTNSDLAARYTARSVLALLADQGRANPLGIAGAPMGTILEVKFSGDIYLACISPGVHVTDWCDPNQLTAVEIDVRPILATVSTQALFLTQAIWLAWKFGAHAKQRDYWERLFAIANEDNVGDGIVLSALTRGPSKHGAKMIKERELATIK